jgi:hypothetical protein
MRCVLAFLYTIPLSVIRATTNQQPGLNVITELIIGYALPGRPIAMMLFKTWGYNTLKRALQFTGDFKLAHYMKIAHRPMFFCQVVATIVAGTVQLGVQAWMFANIEGLCDADQKDGFICPNIIVFGNASIIVSKIVVLVHTFVFRGSKMLFCSGVSLGRDVCFRAVSSTTASPSSSLPVSSHHCSSGYCTRSSEYVSSSTSIFLSLSAARPTCLLRPPLITCSGCSSALSSTISSVDATLTGGQSTTVSRFVIRLSDGLIFLTRNWPLFSGWVALDVLSAGLNAGYAFGLLIVFFILQYPKNGTIGLNSIQTWWGNTVYMKTADYTGVPFKSLPEGGKFGPSSW